MTLRPPLQILHLQLQTENTCPQSRTTGAGSVQSRNSLVTDTFTGPPDTTRCQRRPSLLCPRSAARGRPGDGAAAPAAACPLPVFCFLTAAQRHRGSAQASLPFYGRKMNRLPSSGAERDDRTESCHLLWFWQQENRTLSPQPPLDGQCTPGICRGGAKPRKLLPHAGPSCRACKGRCLLTGGGKPYFCGLARFTKQGIKGPPVFC